MEVIHTVRDLRRRLAGEGAVGLVPTMGSLHEGHLSLVRSARNLASCVVASVFVNRLQFGPGEDYERYPRNLSEDTRLLGAAFIEPSDLQHELEGAVRPGHFRGVCTVVLKLFNMVQPQVALFGKKDYQQWTVLREMVTALSLPVRMVPGDTVRASDGLALSSRNAYLSAEQRKLAPQLQQVLRGVSDAMRSGARHEQATATASAELAARGWQVDYLAVRRQAELAMPQAGDRALVVLGAARLGSTRLIDNLELQLPEA
jgi:pantoate--beta-alanine ligase